ncbi:TIGR03086 family metal-binding protein [Streptomyces sp. NPDC049954]|uniref:TIGR03086 family metal-binding protein n=1 Tax=Streptomyces sp. NPDC049954 TaxID=3155779 RepID=UPI0034387323
MDNTTEAQTGDPYTREPYTVDSPVSDLLARAVERAVPVVRGIGEARFGDPTPCRDYDVRGLLNHLYRVTVDFQAMAARRDVDFAAPAPDRTGEDWRTGFEKEARGLVGAWAAPGAEEGTAGAMGLPARTVGTLALVDLTVHAWDLARATGQGFAPDPVGVEVLHAFMARMGPTGRKMGAFGEPVTVPAEASPMDRLLARTGRDQGWTPPGGGAGA